MRSDSKRKSKKRSVCVNLYCERVCVYVNCILGNHRECVYVYSERVRVYAQCVHTLSCLYDIILCECIFTERRRYYQTVCVDILHTHSFLLV